MNNIIYISSDFDKLKAGVEKILGDGKGRHFLDEFNNYLGDSKYIPKEYPEDNNKNIIVVLWSLYSRFKKCDDIVYYFNRDYSIKMIVKSILSNYDDATCYRILRYAIDKVDTFPFGAVSFVRSMSEPYDAYNSDTGFDKNKHENEYKHEKAMIKFGDLKNLIELCDKKIDKWINDENFTNINDIHSLLFHWHYFGYKNKSMKFVSSRLNDENFIIKLLSVYSKRYDYIGDYSKDVFEFIEDKDGFIEIVKSIDINKYNDSDKKAVKLFQDVIINGKKVNDEDEFSK